MVGEPEGLWLSVADLARARGITRQSAAERVDRLERLGLISTRPGKGRAKLVNVAEFDRASAGSVDGVRSLNGGGSLGPAPAGLAPIASNDPVLIKEQARRASYDADLKRLDLLERLGLVLPMVDIVNAMAECGAIVVRTLDRLPSKRDDLMAAARAGERAADRFLEDLGHELRTIIAEAFQAAVKQSKGERGTALDDIAIPQDSELRSAE